MAHDTGSSLSDDQIAALVAETGATESEIRQIAEIVEGDRSSILREARIVVGQRQPPEKRE